MKAFGILIIVGIVVVAWCPWFAVGDAAQLIRAKVYQGQQDIQDGCVLSIDLNTMEKVPFGYRQSVSYTCSIGGDFVSDGKNNVFVTFYKQVIGVPHPIIK